MSEFVSTCPKCHQRILCDTQYIGKRVACPVCAQEIFMPEPPKELRQTASTPAPGTQPPAAGGKVIPLGVVVTGGVIFLLVVGAGIWVMQRRPATAVPATPTAAAVAPPVTPVVATPRPAARAQWSALDIGLVGVPGSSESSGGTFTINGSGDDIAGLADKFQYMQQPINGDCEIRACVMDVKNTASWAKAGVMIRESLDTNSTFAMVAVTPGQGITFERRDNTGAWHNSTTIAGLTAPYWVRVVRNGNTFAGYLSTNGLSWKPIDSDTISMSASVHIGLAVTSHNDGTICTATFKDVLIKP